MAHSVGDSLDVPIYGSHYLLTFPIYDADGDPTTGAAGLDSEVSIDLGTFADCTNEAVEIASASGLYYLYLTGAEMTGKIITVQVKTSTTGAKTTVLSIHPQRLAVIATGTAQAGGAGTITLAASTSKVDNDLAGLYVRCSNNSPSGVQYATRKIISNVASTQVATVESNWGTNPSSATTYDLLAPASVNVTSFAGTLPTSIATAGVQDVNVKNINNTAAATPGASGGLLIAGSNAATTFSGLTTGALACTTITASGAVAFQSTFGVTGAVTFSSTFATTGTTTFNALTVTNATTLSGAVSMGSTFSTTGTVTFNAFTVTNALTVSGTTTLTGAVTASNASNNIVGIDVAKLAGTAYASTTLFTLASHDPGATIGTSTLTQAQVTGGAYALNSSSFAFNSGLDFTTTQKAATLARVTLVDTATTTTTATNVTTVNGLAANVITAAALASDAVAEIQSGLSSLDAAGIRTAVGLGSANLDTQLDALPTNAELATALSSLQAHGDSAWATATGFSTHTAADVWAVATRLLTAGTNIVLAKGTGVTGFNDIAATAVVSGGAITTSGGAVSTVTALTNKAGFALASTGLDLVVPADPSTVPALGTTTLPGWIAFFACWSLDDVSQTSTATTLKNDAGTAIARYPTSDDGVTFVSGHGVTP